MATNLTAFRSRDFRIYFAGNALSLNGFWMQRVSVGWLAWDLTGSAAFVGLIAFLTYLPNATTGPFFGVLVDRLPIKRTAVIVQSLLFGAASLLFIAFMAGILSPVVLVMFSLIYGLVASAYSPIRLSLAPRLVPREAVGSVVALTSINFNIARMIGPAIGGAIIAHWGIGPALFIQAALYAPFAFALSLLNPRQRVRPEGPLPPFLSDMMDGVRHLLASALIRRAVVLTLIFGIVVRGVIEILPVIADGVFDKGAVGLGLLTSAAGIGALVAGLSKATMPAQRADEIPISAYLAVALGIVAAMLLAQTATWPVAVALVALLAFAASAAGISIQTAVQIDLDDDFRGRVMSLYFMVAIGSAALGAALIGWLSDLVGFQATLTAFGPLALLGLGAVALRGR
jgi:MFS family permease